MAEVLKGDSNKMKMINHRFKANCNRKSLAVQTKQNKTKQTKQGNQN